MSNLYKALRQKYGYDFQIPIYNDRAFKSLVKKHNNFIIKLLSELCNFDIKDVEDSYFLDTETTNDYYDETKMTVDLIFSDNNKNLVNIEMNTNINNSTLIRNNLYIYRIILSKSDNKNKMYENINLTQINIDLKSFNFMKKIVNKFEMIEDTTFEKLPYFVTVYHIGLDKIEQNPYNESISDYAIRCLKIFASSSKKLTKELAGNYKELLEVAKFMNNYSNNLKNLIYYNPDEEAEKIRLTDLHFAREDGYELGVSQGISDEKKNIAKEMLNDGVNIEKIIKYSGLTKEEILKLQDNK